MSRILSLLLALPFLVSVAPVPRALPPAVVYVPPARPVVIRVEQSAPHYVGTPVVRQSAVHAPHQAAQACDQANAVAVLRSFVYGDVHGAKVEIGSAVAWSCTSVEEAQQHLNEQTAKVQQQAADWYGTQAVQP